MALIIRIILILLGLVLILLGAADLLSAQSISRFNIFALIAGGMLLVLSILNGGRRLFSNPDDGSEAEALELVHDISWRNIWTYLTMHFGIVSVLTDKNSSKQRMDARKARVEAARRRLQTKKAKSESQVGELNIEKPDREEAAAPLTDFWKLPKTGAATTVLNSAWTWTLITYVTIMAIAVLSIAQQGSDLLDTQSNTARIAIAVGLVYPAWRIGSLISKFMKKRGIGAGFSVSGAVGDSLGREKPAKAAKPGSVEARMAERKARLEKARQEGKI